MSAPRLKWLAHKLVISANKLERDLTSSLVFLNLFKQGLARFRGGWESNSKTTKVVREEKRIGAAAQRCANKTAHGINMKTHRDRDRDRDPHHNQYLIYAELVDEFWALRGVSWHL